MASNDEYVAYESPLKKSWIKDGFNGQGPVASQSLRVAPLLNNLKMASNDEYHLLKDIDPLAWHYDSENEDHLKLLEDFICQYKKAIEALKYAIEKENEKSANLIFERIDHANMHPPGLFFITFEARNKTTFEVKTYQTRVFRCPFTPSDIEVELFRLKIQPDDK